jgi:SAM-dependent methyltransferase
VNPDEVRQRWEEQSGEYSPDYYAYYGPNETSELLRATLDSAVGSEASVLELGCSSGRHLSHLHEHGYDDLHGIEINDEAFDVMDETYPDLADSGTFYVDAIEEVVTEFEDDQFDAVYSVETLQHIHPDDEWVFEELARITDDLLVVTENEGDSNSADTTDQQSPEKDVADQQSPEKDVTDQQSPEKGVNYVNDEFPLYYRDWSRIFTELGFAEVDSESLKRDTLRVFRLA